MKKVLVLSALAAFSSLLAYGQTAVKPMTPQEQQQMVGQYCAGCHNEKLKSGGLSFAKMDTAHPEQNAELWEKAILKLRAGMMPPSGLPKPAPEVIKSFVTSLEGTLDKVASAKPNPGRPALHRLNRTEYENSIRDLLGFDVDVNSLLPSDDKSHGFDNMADVLNISPTLMESYVRAAGKISRLAVGDSGMSPVVETYHVPQAVSQMKHVEGAPLGTRGGVVVKHVFPADGEYVFKMTFYYSSIGPMFGSSTKGEQIEVALDGERVALMNISPNLKVDDDVRTPPIKIKAGPATVSVAFIEKAAGPVEDFVMPFQQALADLSTGHIPGLTGLPHVRDMGVSGPFHATGVSENAIREKIFTCRPANAQQEVPCAKKIIGTLARNAYRRPVTDGEIEGLLSLYQGERNKTSFDNGIRMALQAILADPEFVFRFERTPAGVAAGTNYRISDTELASRLAFFLWSAPPDETLLTLASQNRLKDPKVLEQQVRRMMASPKADTLATNFAAQWLHMQNLNDLQPDVFLYPDYDRNLAESMKKETYLFFGSVMREDRNVMDLVTADYTFVDERLAKHYGIPNIVGTRFRRVPVPIDARRGLLGQGSILALTSLANRTSPVYRGKWVMDAMLGTPPPTPPPNVPPLDATAAGKNLSVRERQEAHRASPVCAACHRMMDPIGFSLENFDATGAWRVRDSGFAIDASGTLFDGTKVDGASGLRNAIVAHQDLFLRNFTSNLLMYGLGRVVDYNDMPAIRSIAGDAAKNNNRFSTFILDIVKSTPFQMRRADASDNQPTDVAAQQ